MKVKIKKPKMNIKIATIIVALILILIPIAYFNRHSIKAIFLPGSDRTTEQIKEETKTSSDSKKDFINSPSNTGNSSNSWELHNSSDIALSAKQEDNGNVTISTQLKNYSDGSCALTITNGTETYAKTVDVIYQSSFAICAGFSVPKDSLNTGTWQISLSVTSKGATNTQITSLEVK